MTFEESMNEVLESPRYDFLTGRRRDIREVIAEMIDSILDSLFGNLGWDIPDPVSENTAVIATVFSVVALIIISVAAFVLIRAFLRMRIPKRHTLSDIFEELRTHTVAELLELSRSAPNRRTAVRYKYIAAILHLNENNIIVIEPSATNAIILKQIKNSAPQLSNHFSQIADAFHLTWFGHKNFSDENFEKFNDAVGAVVKHA